MMSTDETSNEPHVCLEGTVSMDVKTMSTLCTCLVLVLVCYPFEAMCIGSITSHIEGTVIMWVCSSLCGWLTHCMCHTIMLIVLAYSKFHLRKGMARGRGMGSRW